MEKVKSILFLLIMIGLFLFTGRNAVYAENLPTSPFEVSVDFGTQSPWSHKIPVTIKIVPNIDSKRTEVRFALPNIMKVDQKYDNFFYATRGEEYILHADLIPDGAGVVSGSINVIDWDYGYNYGTSYEISMLVDENMILVPQTDAYKKAVQDRNMLIIGSVIIFLGILVFVLIKLFNRIKQYLTLPEDLKN
jgi:hypothetical protein